MIPSFVIFGTGGDECRGAGVDARPRSGKDLAAAASLSSYAKTNAPIKRARRRPLAQPYTVLISKADE
jgi:hypothetical protein